MIHLVVLCSSYQFMIDQFTLPFRREEGSWLAYEQGINSEKSVTTIRKPKNRDFMCCFEIITYTQIRKIETKGKGKKNYYILGFSFFLRYFFICHACGFNSVMIRKKYPNFQEHFVGKQWRLLWFDAFSQKYDIQDY